MHACWQPKNRDGCSSSEVYRVLLLSHSDGRLIVKKRERNAAAITLFCYFAAITWGYFWLTRGGWGFFAIVGMPGVLLFLIPALHPLLTSQEVEFDPSTGTIHAMSRFLRRRNKYQFSFADFSRIEIDERRNDSRPNDPTFHVRLKRSDSADDSVPPLLPLGWTMDESHAWKVVDAVCEVTGIPIPRDVKHDGPKRRGGKRPRPKRKRRKA